MEIIAYGTSCVSTTATISPTACTTYTVPSGDETYTGSGTFKDTIPNMAGCDSVITINLTIAGLPSVATTVDGLTITAAPGLSYQWINCATNTPIAGQTNQTFTATTNGSYAVIVSNAADCEETSECVTISTVGVSEINSADEIKVYPNPANDYLLINLPYKSATIEVLNSLGSVVLLTQATNTINKIDFSAFPKGVYIIKIKHDGQVNLRKVVKSTN
jgi:hypothetical protein